MLNKIISLSIKNKLIIGLLTIALIGYGTYELRNLPIDAVPDITNNQVQIITVAPALGATDIERLITFPIEQVNSNIPTLKEIRSFSSFGLSVITLVFDDNTDIYWVRQQIAERLQQVQDELPKGFGSPFLAPVTTGLGEIYQYVVKPEKGYEHKYNAMELRTIQDWIIRKQLLGVKGVAEVSSFGGLLKQYEIAIDPEKLLAHNITINEIFTALDKNNQNTGGSYIEKNESALFIRSEGLAEKINDIENIAIKKLPNDIPVLIRDIAQVRYGNAIRYGALTYNGEMQVSGAIVLMLKGANSSEVITNIKKRIEEIKKTLPEGVTIEPFIDRSKMVNKTIHTVTKNLIEGALIVVFVLVLFLGNIRAGLLVASVIPLSMLFAVIMMNLFGLSGNLMSLGALDFGLIVDGAVIIVEAVMHRLSKSKSLYFSQKQMDLEVQQSASKMMNSAIFGQIIILIVYLPIFSLKGIEGKMFIPMAQTVAFALTGAFILSLTYIPMMSSLFLNKKISDKKTFSDKMMYNLEKYYKNNLIRVLRHQKTTLVLVAFLFISAAYLLMQLGGEFMPSLPEGDFAVEARVLPGSNINTSIEAVSKASKILLKNFPEVTKVVTKTGSSEVPTDPMPLYASDMIVVLKDRSEWQSASTYQELESKMIDALKDIPGVQFSFQYPVAMRFNELISGAKQDVVCKIFGENLDTLSYYAEKLGKICQSIDGSSGVYVETVSGLPQIVIEYNRAAIAQYGLTIADVNTIINTAFAGQITGKVYEGEKRYDIVLRLHNSKRKDINDVKNILVPTPTGTQIPLRILANVEIKEGPNQIQREYSQRRIMVGFNVRGRDVQSMVEELQQQVNNKIKLPPGYYISYGGAFKNLQEAKDRLIIAVPVSLLLIFILLYFAFNSVKQGLLIYTAIPLSAIGGIFALALRNITFSVSAGIGFIALFGVAVLNGIVLIAEFNRLKNEGYSNLKRIVIEGTKIRLRPVLITACVASLGFLPMAISNGEGAEVQRPLATVVIGGLLVATFLTLFVLPILYISTHYSKTSKPHIITLVVLLGIFYYPKTTAQTPITLKQAIDTALANNLILKNERLKIEYQKTLINTFLYIPNSALTFDYGQLNSIFNDKKIGISQSISFPSVYVQQKNVLNKEWENSVIETNVQEAKLKKTVSQVFYELQAVNEKIKLLKYIDSLYAEFLNKVIIRLNQGESNILEKITIENQRSQIATQLISIQKNHKILQLQFQLLLNSPSYYTPEENKNNYTDLYIADTIVIDEHPAVLIWKKNYEKAVALTRLEKTKLLPDFIFGYNIMSMQGEGADLNAYDKQLRFQSLQVGIGIPVFNIAQKAKINALKINEIITQNEYEINLQSFKNNYSATLITYQNLLENVKKYENNIIKNADNIVQNANLQLSKGEINYLEWVLLINQSVTLYSDYIETVKNRNIALAELNFYLNK